MDEWEGQFPWWGFPVWGACVLGSLAFWYFLYNMISNLFL